MSDLDWSEVYSDDCWTSPDMAVVSGNVWERTAKTSHHQTLTIQEKNFLLYLIKYGIVNDRDLPSVGLGESDPYADTITALISKGLIDRGRDQSWHSCSVLSAKAVNMIGDLL